MSETRNQAKKTRQTAASSREDRLKKALKSNMARRKAQARARDISDPAHEAEQAPTGAPKTEET